MKPTSAASVSDQLNALLEEYRALYSIALLRMNALDRRVPVTAGAMAAVIAALDIVSRDSQLLVLFSVPMALIWFVRATINHARSFEDVLRRIEEIESAVNELVGKPVMHFQSRHPSKGLKVGGRTGQESVAAVLATSLLVLAAAGHRICRAHLLSAEYELVYMAVLGLVGLIVLREAVRLSRYRYEPSVNLSDQL